MEHSHSNFLTDAQAVALAYQGVGGITYPLHSVNTTLPNTTVPRVVGTDSFYKSNYIDLFPIRNLYIISNSLGTNNSMSINGDWGIINKIPVSAGYNETVYDQTVPGTDYFDCSNQNAL